MDKEEVDLLPVVGDALALAGAAAYSLYVFRIGELIGKKLPGHLLQAWKSAFLTILFGAWGAAEYILWIASDYSEELHPWAGWQHTMSWVLLAISAILPGFCADLAQTKGQEAISATESQVLLATEPLWAAFFGVVLLNETHGPAEYLGGLLVVSGTLVVTGIFTPKSNKELSKTSPTTSGSIPLASLSTRIPTEDLEQLAKDHQDADMFESVQDAEDSRSFDSEVKLNSKGSSRILGKGAIGFSNPLSESSNRKDRSVTAPDQLHG